MLQRFGIKNGLKCVKRDEIAKRLIFENRGMHGFDLMAMASSERYFVLAESHP
jgi:hypothetical protein